MSITPAHVTPEINSTTDGTSFVQASNITPVDGEVLFFALYSTASAANLGTPTITYGGAGMATITQANLGQFTFNTIASATNRIDVWYALVAAGSTAGKITVTYGATQTGLRLDVIRMAGCLTTGANGFDALVQGVRGRTDASVTTSPTLTLATFASEGNICLHLSAHAVNEVQTVGSGFTALNNTAHGTPACSMLTQYKLGTVASPAATWATGSTAACWAGEVAEAVAGCGIRPVSLGEIAMYGSGGRANY